MSRLSALVAGVVAATALVILSPGVASAAGGLSLTVDCVAPNGDGTYTAVFGYDNSTGTEFDVALGETVVPNGPGPRDDVTYSNSIQPVKYQGAQTTHFASGPNRAAFSVQFSAAEKVTWRVSYPTSTGGSASANVVASSASPACTTGPALPGEGNGMGQIMVLATSALIAGIVSFVRRRRTSKA